MMKNLTLLMLSLTALAACAPPPKPFTPEQRELVRSVLTGIQAHEATEDVRNCSALFALNRGKAYDESMKQFRAFIKENNESEAYYRNKSAEKAKAEGYCQKRRANLLANPSSNPFMRVI